MRQKSVLTQNEDFKPKTYGDTCTKNLPCAQ